MYLQRVRADADSAFQNLRLSGRHAIPMTLPLAALIVLIIAIIAGALALAAFVWAVRTKQFSVRQLNKGAFLIFDEDEPVGRPQDMVFHSSARKSNGQDHASKKKLNT